MTLNIYIFNSICNCIIEKEVNHMEYSYDLQSKDLYIGKDRFPAYSLEKNDIGVCTTCNALLMSQSYHSTRTELIVVTKCTSCGSFYANIYDLKWNWTDEVSVSLHPVPIYVSNPVVNELKELEAIPMKKLEAVFSREEIKALFFRAKGETSVRQYLYRARKKYELFEQLFEIQLDF